MGKVDQNKLPKVKAYLSEMVGQWETSSAQETHPKRYSPKREVIYKRVEENTK